MATIQLYSHDWPDKSTQTPAEKQAAAVYRDVIRRNPPGSWSDNRFEQVNHFRDVIYIAIRAIMDLLGSAQYSVYERRTPARDRTTFSKSAVVKALAGTQAEGRDEDYVPCEDLDEFPARLIEQPNSLDTFGEFAAKVGLQNRLTGVGPVWVLPGQGHGKPVELWSLKTPLLNPIWQMSKQYPFGAWRVMPYTAGWLGGSPAGLGAAGAVLPGEQVSRFMDPHPLIDWDGFSPLTAGAVQLDVLESIDDSRKSAMDNGLQLDAFLIAPGMDAQQAEAHARHMTEKVGGAKNARRFGIATPPLGMSDKYDLKTFGTTPREMDYQNGWEQMVKFALALFGVPASVAGLAMTSSYSELYAALRQFHTRQSAYMNRLESWLTKVIAKPWSEFPGQYIVRAKLPTLDDPDLREKQFARQLQYDLLSYNEARAKDDLDPVDGGEVPVSVFVQMKQQEIQPAQPEMGQEMGAEGEPGAAEDDGSDVPDEMTNAALEELGVPSEPVQKAQQRREGEVWQGQSGKWFTLKNGRTTPAKAPGGQSQLSPSQYEKHAQRLKGEHGAVLLTHPSGVQHKIRSGRDLREFHMSGGKIPSGKIAASQPSRPTPPPIPQTPQKQGPAQPTQAQQITQVMGGMAGGMGQGFYDSLANSLISTGDVPSPERGGKGGGSNIARAWDQIRQRGLDKSHNSIQRFVQATKEAMQNGNTPKAWADALNNHFAGQQTGQAAQPAQQSQASPRVSQISQRAQSSPAVKEQLSRAHEWADRMAAQHADRVAQHLGIDRASARHLLASTIKKLCEQALKGGGTGSQTYTGASGKKLTIGVKRKGPTSGAVPQPRNPAGKGSRPPLAKAMSACLDSAGGSLVAPPVMPEKKRVLPLKRAKRAIRKILKSLDTETVGME